MKHGRPPAMREYGWSEVREELEDGIHPDVVAARLGEPVAYIREVAEQQGWAVVWDGPAA